MKVSNKFKFGNMTVGFPQYEFGLKCKLCISKDNHDPISVESDLLHVGMHACVG